jgi:hypothetical protein
MHFEPHTAYVALFDVLGFKALRGREGTQGIAQLFERSLLAMIQHAAAGRGRTQLVGDENVYVPDWNERSLTYRVISDTVIFLAKSDDFDSFFVIVDAAFKLLQAGFGNGRTPFRGAIGHGDLYIRDEIVVGSAVEDAYAAESSQLWAGVMLTSAAEQHAQAAGHFDRLNAVYDLAGQQATNEHEQKMVAQNRRRLIRYDVPLKPPEESRTAFILDWTLRMYEGAVEKALPVIQDPRAAIIRDNTLAFERWARTSRNLTT